MYKNIQYKILTILAIFVSLLILMQCNVFAASFSIETKSSVAPGENFAVTIRANNGKGYASVKAINANLSSTAELDLMTTDSVTLTCTAGSSGIIKISVSGVIADIVTEEDENRSASFEVKIEEPQKPAENPGGNQGGNTSNPGTNTSSNSGNTSSNPNPGNTTTPQASNNANLKMLGITKYDFSGFKKNVYEYKVKDPIPNDVTSVSVYATTDDNGATYTVSGDKNLKVGSNKIVVTVTAADKKTKKDYVIYIERKAANEEEVTPNVVDEEKPDEKKEHKGLQSIILDESLGFDLSPEFKTNVYSYKLKITGDLTSIPLKANAIDEDAKIEITGNEDLVDGENLITIEVTFDDDPDTRFIYKITVLKNVEEKEESEDTKATAATGTTTETKKDRKDDGFFSSSVTVVITVFVVIFIVSGVITFLLIRDKKPKSPWGDDEDEDEIEEPGALEDEKDFKSRKEIKKEIKEKEFEEFEAPRGKGRH